MADWQPSSIKPYYAMLNSSEYEKKSLDRAYISRRFQDYITDNQSSATTQVSLKEKAKTNYHSYQKAVEIPDGIEKIIVHSE
jgi:hypothetical protein